MKRKWVPGLFDFINFRVEDPFLRKLLFHPPSMRRGFHALVTLFKLANLPVVRWFHPWAQPWKTKTYIVPVHKTVEHSEDVAVPYQLVERFIDKSSYRVIMDFCACRTGNECKKYPVELGCLMMGEDARRIPSAWARPVTREEAKEHLQKGVAAGLPCFVGKIRVDNYIFAVPDTGRLVSMCFCCECCCLGREILQHLPPERRNVQYNRLDGLKVWVEEDKCIGCGICAENCFLGLIEVTGGKAVIPEDCRGCGRCVKYCSQDAIRLKLENPDYIDQAVRAIETIAKV